MNYRRPNYKQTTTMNEPQHTPGPWIASTPPSSSLVTRQIRAEDGTHIADLGCPMEARAGIRQDIANARLIASAPDLLEALLVLTLTPGILAHIEAHDPKALNQARAAIAQAEGGGK